MTQVLEAKPFELNLPEVTPAGRERAPEIFAAPTRTMRTETDELYAERDELVEDPVLHR